LATAEEAIRNNSSSDSSCSSGSGSNNVGVPVWRSPSGVAAFSSVVLFLVAACIYSHALPGFSGNPGAAAASARLAAAPRRLTADPCDKLPSIKIEKMLVNNLGGHGPEKDKDPFMVFEVTMSNVGLHQTKTTAHLKVSTFTDYVPNWVPSNGLHGEWVAVSLKGGTSVGLVATFHDPETDTNLIKNLTIPHGYMTFSDIDSGRDGEKEFLMVPKFYEDFYVGDHTALQTEKHLFTTTFWGTHVELGHDNPTQHGELFVIQKKKAVTMSFPQEGFKAATFKFGSLPGKSARELRFSFRPAMLCSRTRISDDKILDAMERGQGNPFPRVNGNEPVDLKSFSIFE